MWEAQIKAVIAIKNDQDTARRRKGSRGGRPPAFDKVHYRDRNTVERAVNKLRAHRAVGTRYDNATTPTAAPSPSRRSRSGSATPSPTHYGTLPSPKMQVSGQATPPGEAGNQADAQVRQRIRE